MGEYQVALVRDEKDGTSAFQSGDFRVEQYRVPTMRAVIQPPSRPLVRPGDVTLDLFVSYLSGGGASRAPVRLRTMLEPRTPGFRDYPDFTSPARMSGKESRLLINAMTMSGGTRRGLATTARTAATRRRPRRSSRSCSMSRVRRGPRSSCPPSTSLALSSPSSSTTTQTVSG